MTKINVLTDDEAWQLFEDRCQDEAHMGAVEFLTRYYSETLPQEMIDNWDPDYITLEMLIPFAGNRGDAIRKAVAFFRQMNQRPDIRKIMEKLADC